MSSSSLQCAGFTCPGDTLCDNANQLCITADQKTACDGLGEGMDCTLAGVATPGMCKNGTCIPSRCGDGMIRGAERCDGANLDGKSTCRDLGYYSDAPISCTADCVFNTDACGTAKCGDHIVQTQEFCEDAMVPSGVSCLDFGFDIGRVGCSTACNATFDVCRHFGLFPVVSGTTKPLASAWASGANNIYAVGLGAITHFDGQTWTAMDPNTTSTLLGVHGISPTDIWAVGTSGIGTHFDGSAWSATTIGMSTDFLFAVWGNAANNVFAVGTAQSGLGVILHYDGTAWGRTEVTQPLQGVYGFANNDVWAVGDIGYVTHFDGNTWTPQGVGTKQFQHVWGTDANNVWAFGSGFAHKTASGWTVLNVPEIDNEVFAVTEVNGRLYIGDESGLLVGTLQNGFLRIPSVTVNALLGFATDNIWAVSVGGMRQFTGTAWLEDVGRPAGALSRVHGSSSTNIAVTTSGGRIQIWDGHAWSAELTALPNGAVSDTWVAGVDDLYASSDYGAVWHWYRDTASDPPTWHQMTAPGGSFQAIWGRDANDIWAAGDQGKVDHFTGTWTPMTTPTNQTLHNIFATSPTDVWAVGGQFPVGVILHYNGSTWTKEYEGTDVPYAVWGTAPNNVYVVGLLGVRHYDGTTWKQEDAGVFTSLVAIYGTAANDIFVAGGNGSLTHFDGSTWSPVRSPTQLLINAVFATSTRVVTVGDASSRILYRN